MPVTLRTIATSPEPREETRPAPELFSQEQLEAHAEQLAQTQTLAPDPGRAQPLSSRLDKSAEVLEDAYYTLTSAAHSDARPVGSEDWLRDNFHVVQDQIRAIRQDLPRKYYLELPKLADGPFEGYPRVYVLARELVIHTAGRFDLQTLIGFATAFQRGAPLSIGEIWAIPIMLRFALVEELQRLATDVVKARRSRESARRWGLLFADPTVPPNKVISRALREASRTSGRLPAAFVVELLQWLRDQPASAAPAWEALHERSAGAGRLARGNASPRAQARGDQSGRHRQHHHQHAAPVLDRTGRCSSSGSAWSSRSCAGDPAGAYGKMDFPTRDRYRHSVEELAKGAKQPETEVARRVVALAEEAVRSAPEQRSPPSRRLLPDLARPLRARSGCRLSADHPGSAGAIRRSSTRSSATWAPSRSSSPPRRRQPAVVRDPPRRDGYAAGLRSHPGAAAGERAGRSAFSISIVTSHVPPRQLPKLRPARTGFRPPIGRWWSFPAIVESEARVLSLLDELEVRFFANRDTCVHFALLTDFADADAETTSTDESHPRHSEGGHRPVERTSRSPIDSSCSIGNAAGTLASIAGWGGNASAAS